jgi:hypothetical protein
MRLRSVPVEADPIRVRLGGLGEPVERVRRGMVPRPLARGFDVHA